MVVGAESCSYAEMKRLVNKTQSSLISSEGDINNLLNITMSLRENINLVPTRPFFPSKVGLDPISNEKCIALEDIPPGTLLFKDVPQITYPNFLVTSPRDYLYKLIDVRSGILPRNWICICCMTAVGGIVPVWCKRCDLPLCHNCGVIGKHQVIDSLCTFAHDFNVRGRRFLNLGEVYLDVALTRFFFLIHISETFRHQVACSVKNASVQTILSTLVTSDIGNKFNKKALPLTFNAANGSEDLIFQVYALLVAYGVAVYPRIEIGIFHLIFEMLVPSCFPNVEAHVSEDGKSMEIMATSYIQKGEFLYIDFLQQQLLPTVYRHRLLKSRWRVGCVCVRCRDPTEFGTFIGSVLCQECQAGFLTPLLDLTHSVNLNEDDLICACMNPFNPHRICYNKCPFKLIKYRNCVMIQMIKQVAENNSFSPLTKYKAYDKMKEVFKQKWGFHENYFVFQFINGHLPSPGEEFVRVNPVASLALDFVEFVAKGDDYEKWECEMEERLANFDGYETLVLQLTPQSSRFNGYILFEKAQLEITMMRICLERCKLKTETEFALRVRHILSVTPKIIAAWKEIILHLKEDDLNIINTITSFFVANPVELRKRQLASAIVKNMSIGNGDLVKKTFAQALGEIFHIPLQMTEDVCSRTLPPCWKYDEHFVESHHTLSLTSNKVDQIEEQNLNTTPQNQNIEKELVVEGAAIRDEAIEHPKYKSVTARTKKATERQSERTKEVLVKSMDLLPIPSVYIKARHHQHRSTGQGHRNFHLSETTLVFSASDLPRRTKPNKLKEALIRQQAHKRIERQTEIRKQLLMNTGGSEPKGEGGVLESLLQTVKGRTKGKHHRKSKSTLRPPSLQVPVDMGPEENDQSSNHPMTRSDTKDGNIPFEDDLGPQFKVKQTQSHLMQNPIPIHHSSNLRRHFRQRYYMHDQYNQIFRLTRQYYRHNGVDVPYTFPCFPETNVNSGITFPEFSANLSRKESSSQGLPFSQSLPNSANQVSPFLLQQQQYPMYQTPPSPRRTRKYSALKYLCGSNYFKKSPRATPKPYRLVDSPNYVQSFIQHVSFSQTFNFQQFPFCQASCFKYPRHQQQQKQRDGPCGPFNLHHVN